MHLRNTLTDLGGTLASFPFPNRFTWRLMAPLQPRPRTRRGKRDFSRTYVVQHNLETGKSGQTLVAAHAAADASLTITAFPPLYASRPHASTRVASCAGRSFSMIVTNGQ